MTQDNLDLALRLNVDFQIIVGSRLGVATLNVLTHHYKRHEQNLNYIGNEEPEHESHRRIELQLLRSQKIPAQPDSRPYCDYQEESHRSEEHTSELQSRLHLV